VADVQRHAFVLDEFEMPTQWYNVIPDLPSPPPPPLHPGTFLNGRKWDCSIRRRHSFIDPRARGCGGMGAVGLSTVHQPRG